MPALSLPAGLIRHSNMRNTDDLRMSSSAPPFALKGPLQMFHGRVQFGIGLNPEDVPLSQRKPLLFYIVLEGEDRVPGGIPFITRPHYTGQNRVGLQFQIVQVIL